MAVDAFIKIEGIDGASNQSKHKGEIEVLSFSWGVKNSAPTGGGGGAGKAQVSDFSFTKEIAKDSPELFVAVCQGEHFKQAILTVEGMGGANPRGRAAAFYKVTFADVLISSVSLAGQGNDVPMEQVSLNFAKVEIEFRDARGSTKVESCNFIKGE